MTIRAHSSAVERPVNGGEVRIKMFHVYILKSLKDKRYYIGSTKNLEQRLIQHNSGQTKSLKYRLPLKLIYKEEYQTLYEARKREGKIKSFKGGNAFKKLIAGR